MNLWVVAGLAAASAGVLAVRNRRFRLAAWLLLSAILDFGVVMLQEM